MEARFNVVGTFHRARNDALTFVMYGDVVDGEVVAGMLVRIPFNSAVCMEGEVGSVELIENPAGSHVALTIHVNDQAELEIWKGLNIGSEEVLVVEAGAGAA